MTPELKTQWVEALRSGEYKQTKGFLSDDKGHCCLGVLCEIRGYVKTPLDDQGTNIFTYNNTEESGELTSEMLKDVGITDGDQQILANKNDGAMGVYPQTFAEIADWIEANF